MSAVADVAESAVEFAKEAKFCRVISVVCLVLFVVGLAGGAFLICTTIMQGNQILAVQQEQLRDVKAYQSKINDILLQQQAILQQTLVVQKEMLKEVQDR